jgi:hypothetical protein
MTTVDTSDRASRLLADLVWIVSDNFTNTLRPLLLARLRDELHETKQEGFSEALEMRDGKDN